jgi:hypothetical protein
MDTARKVFRAKTASPKTIKSKPVKRIQTAEGLKRSMNKKRGLTKKLK